MMPIAADVVVLVVGFRNAGDVRACLRALARAAPRPGMEVFIAENGGPRAMDALIEALCDDPACAAAPDGGIPLDPSLARRRRRLRWHAPDGAFRFWVNVAEMAENLGYAGGVNAWLRPLLKEPGWQGAWVLNPDTEPAPGALAALVERAAARGRGMVASRLQPLDGVGYIHSRGLAWRWLIAKTAAVDHRAPCDAPVDVARIEARLDAPSGASLYATRALIEAIGLMEDGYFLYFEDLEWGWRAKRHDGGIAYAHDAVVPHQGASTTRGAAARGAPAPLTVYLEFRNRILFMRRCCPAWLPWTAAMQVLHALALLRKGVPGSVLVALRGLAAGLRGETGRPDHLLPPARRAPAVEPEAGSCAAGR